MSGCERKVSPVVVLSPNGAYLRNDSFYGLLGVENDALSQSAGMGPQFKILVRIQNAGQGLGRFRDDCGICGKINGGPEPPAMVCFHDFLWQKLGALTSRKVGVEFSGWWFGTFFIFPYSGNNHPN